MNLVVLGCEGCVALVNNTLLAIGTHSTIHYLDVIVTRG